MNCKFCNAELGEDVTLCPVCGKENLEEPVEVLPEAAEEAADEMTEASALEGSLEADAEVPEEAAGEIQDAMEEVPVKAKPKAWLVVLAAIGALAIAAVLGIAVYFGIHAAGAAKSYTVSDAKAEKVRETVVATVGDMELTNSQLQVCYWQAANDFYSYVGSYLDSSVLDFGKPLDEQFYSADEGITWQSFFLDNALNTWQRYAALNMRAKSEGFALSAEAQTYLDTIPQQLEEMAVSYGYESGQAMLSADMSAACDTQGYLDYIGTNFFASQYLDSIYDSLVPTMDEIAAYYQQNEETLAQQGIVNDGSVNVDVRHILLVPKSESNADTYSEAEWELCRQEAQKLLDQWKAGEATEEAFAQLATEHTQDPGSMSTGGLYTDVYVGQMVEPFENWCFDGSRAYGDTGLVKTDYGYHIMYFVESREVWIGKVRDAIINERSTAVVNEAVESWPMDVNYKKIALGQPEKQITE